MCSAEAFGPAFGSSTPTFTTASCGFRDQSLSRRSPQGSCAHACQRTRIQPWRQTCTVRTRPMGRRNAAAWAGQSLDEILLDKPAAVVELYQRFVTAARNAG